MSIVRRKVTREKGTFFFWIQILKKNKKKRNILRQQKPFSRVNEALKVSFEKNKSRGKKKKRRGTDSKRRENKRMLNSIFGN